MHGIRSCRLMYKEVVEALSNVVIQLGVTGLKKTKVMHLLDLFERRREKGQCDSVCLERL